ncbi:hypothetical protein [Psychromonas hadalis]|uniref:hypothetical protein n=1 Tax=Psychromonas hadalis TaxID=211669 RepID=UPI0003B3CB7A|nr:hypothetical protein [Psychromonas hadalis]
MNNDIYQKQYDFELEQRNSIASATNIPVVALTVIGSALSTMIVGFKYNNHLIGYAFILLSIASVLLMFVALYYSVRSFHGYSYQKIPPAKDMEAHYSDLLSWHSEQSEDSKEIEYLAKLDFKQYFNERLSEAAEHNGSNNIQRGNYLHDATRSVVISFVFIALSAPIYVINNVKNNTDINKVTIVNHQQLKAENITMATKPEPKAPSAPSAKPMSAKPTGPQNVVFKGNSGDRPKPVASSNVNTKK